MKMKAFSPISREQMQPMLEKLFFERIVGIYDLADTGALIDLNHKFLVFVVDDIYKDWPFCLAVLIDLNFPE